MATTAKIAKDVKLDDGPQGQNAEAAVPAPQPLLALRTAARHSCASSAFAASASASSRSNGRDSRRDQGELVGRK